MRHFDGRQGVYLHRPSNKHLAQGYAAFYQVRPEARLPASPLRSGGGSGRINQEGEENQPINL